MKNFNNKGGLMKKIIFLITIFLLGITLSVTAFGVDKKTLIVYFSLPEGSDPNNLSIEGENSTVVIDGKVLGNTEYMAKIIQENTGADIYRIVPKIPYDISNHRNLTNFAKEEQKNNARPEIANKIIDVSQYDTLFIGYPIWWADLPMILYTFFDNVDLSGKTIIPFGTHGGSGFAGTVETIKKLEPKAKVSDNGRIISRNAIANSEKNIINWLESLGYKK